MEGFCSSFIVLWLNFLGERTVSMLYLRQTCLSSIWYYCLCQLHTITINAMLHGLRQMDSHLGTAMRKPFSCITIYVKNPPSSPPVGCARRSHSSNWQRPLVETFYHPSLADLRAIFLVLARTLLFQPLFLQLRRAQLLFLS